jgi:hypothetical protein
MKLRRQIFLTFATALFACVSASTAFASVLGNSTSYAQNKVSSGKFPIHSACMMPPQGRLVKISFKSIGFNSVQEMPESKTWTDDTEAMVESHLKARGISITSATNPLSSGASADAIQEVIAQVQQKLKAVSALMNKKPKAIAKSAYTLGDQVEMLPCSENSDIVVFVQAYGRVATAASGLEDGADLFITLADAKTGEILDLIRLYPGGNFTSSAEAYFGPDLDIELLDMNIGAIPRKAKKSTQ